MKQPISLTIAEPHFQQLYQHLFPGDHDEHGAVLVAGIADTPRGTRLLVREVILAQDGIDYIPGKRGYRALTAKFVAEVSGYCAEQNLCYLAVHCHGGQDRVKFSSDDLASHERGYPALLDITNGGPVGALVFAQNAVAGDIWVRGSRFHLDYMTILGQRIRRLYPSPQPSPIAADPTYDRQARMFGDLGQEILANLKVGIIGLGGGGSILNQALAYLGVGHIVGIDFDRVELSNRSRIVGSNPWDIIPRLAKNQWSWSQKLSKLLAKHKVNVARRVAKQANPSLKYDAIIGDVVDESTALLLRDVDFLFLATDTMQSRLVFNALVYQYLIPGMQIGAKVPVDHESKQVKDIFAVTRPVLPYPGGGCLKCHELISASRLQEEALSQEERRLQRYIEDEDIPEPSVITLNLQSAAPALNDFLMMLTGLYTPNISLEHTFYRVQERVQQMVEPRSNKDCLDCSSNEFSRFAKGDRSHLPCRQRSPS